MELLTLGTPGMRGDGDPPPLSPKNLAVLAYLAVSEPAGSVRRDTLVGLFWPELDQEHARNSLNQVLYQLRRQLGDRAIVSRGKEEVELDPNVVACDAVRFRERVEARDWDGALALYRGDFLEGFHLSGAPGFERWRSVEWRRLRRLAVEAAQEAAREAEAEGSRAAAIALLRRAREIAPTDEEVTRRLVTLLDRAGDRAGAVRAYRLFAARLEEELGLEPSPETRRLLEAIRGRERASERATQEAVAPVPEAACPQAAVPQAAGEPADRDAGPDRADAGSTDRDAGPDRADAGSTDRGAGSTDRGAEPAGRAHAPRARAVRLPATVGTAVLLVVAVAAFLLVARRTSSAGNAGDVASVAVLPFTNVGNDSAARVFSDGLASDLLDALASVEGLRVAARTSSFRFGDADVDVRAIGDSLGVGAVLEGAVRESADRLKVSVQLSDAGSGYQLWSASFERALDMESLFRLQEEIARSIALALRVRLTDRESREIARLPTRDLEAYSLYHRAREAAEPLTLDGFARAEDLLRRALARDSTFADAWAALGLVYTSRVTSGNLPLPPGTAGEMLRRGRAAVDRALALDDRLPEAWAGRGLLLRTEGHDRAAERAYRRAIELQPGYARAHGMMASLLSSHGREGEALEQVREARLLDPMSPAYTGGMGRSLYDLGRFEEAIPWLRRALEMGPYPRARVFLPLALAGAGRLDEAREALGGLDPRQHPHERILWVTGLVETLAGTPKGRAILDTLKAMALRGRPDTASATTEVAWLYSAMGEVDSAFAWYDRFRDWDPIERQFLRGEPFNAPLRRDPRYAALVRRADPEYPTPVPAEERYREP